MNLVLYIIIVLLGVILARGSDTRGNKRKWYVIIIISLLVLESALRSVVVGPDTIAYYNSFNQVASMSWGDVFSSFRTSYLEGEGKDPGYVIFMKVVQFFSRDFNVFLFCCALPFFIPLGKLLYRCTTSVMQLIFAFTLYVALFHIIALSGIRQQIATGFCFIAFLQMDEGKNWKALAILILGSTIHISALIFLTVLVLRILSPRVLKAFHLVSFGTIPFVIWFAAPIVLFLSSFLANDYYSAYAESESNGGAMNYIILMELMSLFCYIAIQSSTLMEKKRDKLLYSMLPMLTVTVPLISLNGAMIRVGQYFTLYMMLLVPLAIDRFFKGESRIFVYFGMIAALIVLTLKGDSFEYYFFWQNTLFY